MAGGQGDGNGGYDPTEYARGVVNRPVTDASAGIGTRAEKNPVATLRIIGSNLGNQWIAYGHVGGGNQDYRMLQSADKSSLKVACDWFYFLYRGPMIDGHDQNGEDRFVFGDWKIMVRGSGLEPLCNDIGKHTRPMLRAGEVENSLQPLKVESITISAVKMVPQDGVELE